MTECRHASLQPVGLSLCVCAPTHLATLVRCSWLCAVCPPQITENEKELHYRRKMNKAFGGSFDSVDWCAHNDHVHFDLDVDLGHKVAGARAPEGVPAVLVLALLVGSSLTIGRKWYCHLLSSCYGLKS